MNIIIDYNRTIFDPETNDLYVGVSDLLERISQSNSLFLVSRNEPQRAGRLRSFGIEKYFQRVDFVNEKNADLFRELGNGAAHVLVVGDSVRDEITIGNSLGYITVRVRQGKFQDEVPNSVEEIPTHEIYAITELEPIILNYEK